MPLEENLPLPFVTRKMLDFEQGTVFSLVIQTQSDSTSPIRITGATKAGVFSYVHTPTNDSIIKTETFNIPDIPIFVSVTDPSNNYLPNEIYVRLNLAINGDVIHQLAGGFVFGGAGISWPNTNLVSPMETLGNYTTVASPNPAAGVEITFTVPTNQQLEIDSLNFQLVTDANAATRQVEVRFNWGTGNYITAISPITQAASLTRNYSVYFGGSGTITSLGTEIYIPMPPKIILNPGNTITTVTTAKQATDNFGAMIVHGYIRYVNLT